MRSRPILFSKSMVQKILSGEKTQTRRPMFPQPEGFGYDKDGKYMPMVNPKPNKLIPTEIKCPLGFPGDFLWVRETFKAIAMNKSMTKYAYRASGEYETWDVPWNPSIHMPREASRITLAVMKTRFERLNQISIEDAIAEGFAHGVLKNPKLNFLSAWKQIYGKYSVVRNPWVWVCEFKMEGGK